MHRGREKWNSGEPSAQTSDDDDPDWMWHKPAPDKWEQILDNMEKAMSDQKYEQKEGEGAAFRNSNKNEEWMADWTGEILVGGKLYWINMYDNTSQKGTEYRKIYLKPKEGVPNTGGGKWDQPAPPEKKDDGIPW